MTSKKMRLNPNFIRDGFPCEGEYEIPIIRKETLPDGVIDLVACSRTRPNDTDENRRKGVHFFVDDYRFDVLRRKPDSGLEKYCQYAFILSPDFSRYNEMPVWKVIEAVGMNRWMGAYWQSKGMKVIPAVGWATPFTYRFCFMGVESIRRWLSRQTEIAGSGVNICMVTMRCSNGLSPRRSSVSGNHSRRCAAT